MKINLHPTDPQWQETLLSYYGDAYHDLESTFQQILARGFMKSYWIPEPIAMDYLCKIMIRFLPVTGGKHLIEEGIALCTVDSSTPQNTIRFYESIGEMILWWTALYHERIYKEHGKRMFSIAYEHLHDVESSAEPSIFMPGQEADGESPRLRVNKLFSEQFDHFLDVLEQSEMINDPGFNSFRQKYMEGGNSIH